MSCGHGLSEQGKDHQFPQLQGRGGHGPTQRREVVLVALADLLDEPVGPEPLETAGKLGAGQASEVAPELPGVEAADGELAPEDGAEQVQIRAVEQVEAAVAPLALVDRRDELLGGAEPGP